MEVHCNRCKKGPLVLSKVEFNSPDKGLKEIWLCKSCLEAMRVLWRKFMATGENV